MATAVNYKQSPKGAAYSYQFLESRDVEAGGAERVGAFPPSDMAAESIVEKQLRLGFIRKVYGILSLQLLLTLAVCAVCVFVDPVRSYLLTNLWPFYTATFGSLGVLIAMMCYQTVHPTNIILLGLWTVMEAVVVGVVVASYASAGAGAAVVQAAFLTFGIFIALTAFTMQSKIDFSFLGAGLFAATWALLLWGLVLSIFGWRQSFLYSLFGAVIFALYILFDTSLIMKRVPYDQYVLAAISLYLDILNLFIFLLDLLANRSDR